MGKLYIFGAINIIGWILALLGLFVLYAAIRFKVFTKAGVAGWKSFIPIYGDYMEYQMAWSTKWFWINLAASCGCSLLILIPLIGPILAIAGMCITYFISVFFNLQMAKAFGQSDGFGIGLLLCAPIFRFLIAFDHDIKYVGPQKDPAIFNSAKKEVSNTFNKSEDNIQNTDDTIEQHEQTIKQEDIEDDDNLDDVYIEKLN